MKRFFGIIIALLIGLLGASPAVGAGVYEVAAAGAEASNSKVYFIDTVGVTTAQEQQELNQKLAAFREENKFDVVIVFVSGVSPANRMATADDIYDNYGYGYGDNYDGTILLVNINEDGSYSRGNSWISTCGSGIKYISDEDIQDMGDRLTPLLLSRQFYEAAYHFPNLVEKQLTWWGLNPEIGIVVLIAIVISIVVAFVYTGSLKRQLKSVVAATDADGYIVQGSLNITRGYDHFLYAHVTKTERPRNNSSSTHSSSSGRSHGGGGF